MTRAGEKLLTTTLGAGCAVLFAVALVMQLGVGRGYHWLEREPGNADSAAAGEIDRASFELPPQANFVVIGERPLFNEDRKPQEEAPESTPDTPPPSPLNISLTGTLVVANPEMRVAMVRENGKLNTVALKEGMPLPGDQAAWTLSQVKSRSAIFKNTAGEEAEVELAVVSASQKAGGAPRPGGPANRSTTSAVPPPGGPVAQSEELQHRIEERRKQMREAAERMKAQQPPGQPSPQPQPDQQ